MSQVKVSSIVDTSGGNTVTINGYTPTLSNMAGRNRIINGAMNVWQRGTSGFTTNGNYSADRWRIAADTSLSAVAQSTDVPSGFKYSLSVAGTGYTNTIQRIEAANTFDLVGQSVTLSFWLKQTSGAGTNSIVVALDYANASDNFSGGTTNISSSNISATSSWVQYTVTFSSLPANTANGLQVRLYANTSGATTYLITGVQLEAGSVATPFERRPYGTELALCQRYYTLFTQLQADWSSGGNGAVSVNYAFKVSMRATPTVTKVGTWTISTITSQPAIGTITADNFNIATGGQSGNCAYNSGVNALGVVTATAEL